METLKLKKLASVPSEDNFESSTSKHFIVEDGGELKRLGADSIASKPFVVTFTYTEGVGFSADKTLAQITAAKNAGKYVEGVFNDQYCPLVKLTNEMALFQRLATSSTGVNLDWMAVFSNGCMADEIPLEVADTTVTVSETDAVILPDDRYNYNCGELVSLTITNSPETGSWSVVFTSGSPATDCNFPDSLQWQNDTAPTINANKIYEIIVNDNRAVCREFPIAG